MHGLRLVLGVLIGVAVAACGDDGGSEVVPDAMSAQPDAQSCAPGGIMYLNQNAGSYTRGLPDNAATNQSSILDKSRTFDPFTGATWADAVTCIREGMSPFNVSVVETDPGDVDHTEVVFTSTPPDAWPGMGVFSVSPFDCSPQDRPIVFVFAGLVANDAQEICNNAMSAYGPSAAGLDHAFKCEDYMTYLDGCGPKAWIDENVPCGEFEARPCQCGGNTQNSYQKLLTLFGASCQ